MLKVSTHGDWTKTDRFLDAVRKGLYMKRIDHFGQLGVEALAQSTPKSSGKTASSWYYKIEQVAGSNRQVKLSWYNSNVNDGVCIAVILQYGHGTGTGGYVGGTDYINPAIDPVIEQLKHDIWLEVISL